MSQQTLAIATRRHRRTVLVELRGELDLCTIDGLTAAIDAIKPHTDGVRHIVVDLRGLTFMDLAGLRELLKQATFARANHHNLAVVRGPHGVRLLFGLTDAEQLLVLVDDPDELSPPAPVAALRIVGREAPKGGEQETRE